MSEFKIDAKKQFSKRLARWTSIFWFIYMAWLSVLLFIVPESALYCVYMSIIVTVMMIVNVTAYTRNSTMEKMLLAMLNKTKLDLSLKGVTQSTVNRAFNKAKESIEAVDDDIEDDETQQEDNG